MKNDMNNLFVSGYPKSGTSYLTRLTAHVLNASIGGSYPGDNKEPIAINKPDSEWIVRKGHYRLVHYHNQPLLPSAHTLNTARLQNEPIFFIIRDPRDIVVSASFYHRKVFDMVISDMVQGRTYGLPAWDHYVNDWTKQLSGEAQFIKYEDLIDDPASILRWHLTIDYDEAWLNEAVERQSFEEQKKIDKHNLLRKGIVGDYKNHLSKSQIQTIESAFDETMERWEYV